MIVLTPFFYTKSIFMNSNHPAWLKAMQNGSIGEARSKAFLLDRFWVLERSVDIEGADFIIQRRLTQKNLLDREAPRLGVVQVKFFGNHATTHHIHKRYVFNDSGELRTEFFLLCHTGDEEDQKIFLLSSEEIKANFSLTGECGNEKFRIPYDRICTNSRFKVTSRRRALDRIEHQLELADFVQNRRFLSWMLPDANHNISAILPLYREQIDNWWGDLPKSFEEIKRTAKKALIDVENIHEKLVQITAEIDPLIAQEIIEEIAYECRDGMGRWSISLPNDLGSDDFFSACRQHRFVVERLKEDGLLDAFLDLKKHLRAKIFEFLSPHFPFDSNAVHSFTIEYNSETLSILAVNSKLIPAAEFFGVSDAKNRYGHVEIDTGNYSHIRNSHLGHIDYFWLPGRYRLDKSRAEETIDMYYKADFSLYRDCMDRIFELKYGDLV